MSSGERETTIFERLDERPSFHVKKVARVGPRDLLFRFLTGGLTSVGAGLVTLVFGARAGGIFLAFPAILAASLTLIEQQENSVEAREDARGATVGGFALAIFAVVAALTLGQLSAGLALALAALAWLGVALAGYFALWWR
jgi:Protein of unknown function (DUF3147)